MQRILTSPSALAELAAQLASQDCIGLDTEFLRERTYRAELCLLQVSLGADAVCVDPLAVRDLGALRAVLSSDRPLKIMHAARQDIEVLLPAVGVVRPVFDTQVAAALSGMPAQVGYAELVRSLLGVELAKAHTRTDWTRRPLSPEQVEYALDDVRYLPPLRRELEERLARLGRSDWLREELTALDDTRGMTPDPEQAWRRLRYASSLDPARARLAQALAAWRERRAIEHNKPRGWILDDAVLREVIMRVPRDLEALAAVPDMPPAVVRHSGAELLAYIHAAGITSPAPPPRGRERPDPVITAQIRKLGEVTQQVARDLGLQAEVLATRRDLEQLARGERDVGALRGWRRRTVGEALLAAL